tara:strand:- start:1956 stop:2903 length:948 start_codon:yes stop_codon:yes gene_type:complete
MDHCEIRVAVVGASGFIGSHLVDHLLGIGCKVTALSRTYPDQVSLGSKVSNNFSYVCADITDKQSLIDSLVGVDVIVHSVSGTLPHTSNKYPDKDITINLQGSLNLMDAAIHNKVAKFVFISSGGTVYGTPKYVPIDEAHPTNPICSYGIVKLAIEKYAYLYNQIYGLDTTILRLANPYGERQRIETAQGVIPIFLHRAIHALPITIWGDGSTVRDFVYISDVVQSIALACNYSGPFATFNVGSGIGCSLNDLISMIENITDRKLDVNYLPSRSFDVPTNVLSISNSINCLNWSPQVDLREGLFKAYNYIKNLSA